MWYYVMTNKGTAVYGTASLRNAKIKAKERSKDGHSYFIAEEIMAYSNGEKTRG